MTVRDIGKIMNQLMKQRTESSPGAYSPQRNCTGPCRRRRSHTQFTRTNTMCNLCTRRAPQPQGIAA